MTRIKREGRADGQPTNLIRYDVYLHLDRDRELIEYLNQFQRVRGCAAEARSLLYFGYTIKTSNSAPAQHLIPLRNEPQRHAAVIEPSGSEGDTADVRNKMKRAFG